MPNANANNQQLAASLQAELMKLGFILDEAGFVAVIKAPSTWLAAYHVEIVDHIGKRVGADRNYQPFYRNFPAQVMEMSHFALFINALVHYWSNGAWEPPQTLRDRGFAFENVEFKRLRLGTEEELKKSFTRLVSINQSLTERDKEIVAWMIDTYGAQLNLPPSIPFKETLCILAAKGLDVPVSTTIDVLRVAVYLSGGDISLPGVPKLNVKPTLPGMHQWHLDQLRTAQKLAREKFRFKKFKRAERRMLLGLLEKTNVVVTDMQRHMGRWLRLGEILHVGEFATRFPRAAEAFARLRNQPKGSKIRTFSARVNMAFAEDAKKGMDLLAARPGEFARRLDWMLRKFEPASALSTFERIAPDVSAKVLFELSNHFSQRSKAGVPRSVMIKGVRSKMKTLPTLPPMDAALVTRVMHVIHSVMLGRIAKLAPLGNVWIDERLKEVPVPFAMRSINTAVKTYVRGTRIPFRADAKVIRPFIHWFDEQGEQDLDLSVGLYTESLASVGQVSWTGLKDLGCCHSGDIRHRRGPCAEYVDIPVDKAIAHGVRYAVVHVYNYNARPMHTVKDCVFGLMEREHAEANEIFVPKTIANCMALANESTSVVVCIVDLARRNYIWADIESERELPTLENSASKSAQVLAALVNGTKMSVYDLLIMHGQERGAIVTARATADVTFDWEDLITDYAKVGSFMNF